jgi:hypothetical protein
MINKQDILKRYNYGIELETSKKFTSSQKEYLYDKFKAKVVHDGSIDGEEINSEILPGEKVEQWVDDVCKYLASIKMTVNKKCGFHLHMSPRYMPTDNVQYFKSMLMLYKRFEPAMFAMMPPSRARSSWCSPVSMSYSEIEKINSENSIYKYYYREKRIDEKKKESLKHDRYCGSRYYNLNLHSWFYRGSIEIRMHSGTVNPIKIKNWIYINTAMMERSNASPLSVPDRAPNVEQSSNTMKENIYRVFEDDKLTRYVDERIAKFSPDVEEAELAIGVEPVTVTIKRRISTADAPDNWKEVSRSLLLKDIAALNKELEEFVETYKLKADAHKEEWVIDNDITIQATTLKTTANAIAAAISSKATPRLSGAYSAI